MPANHRYERAAILQVIGSKYVTLIETTRKFAQLGRAGDGFAVDGDNLIADLQPAAAKTVVPGDPVHAKRGRIAFEHAGGTQSAA